MSASFDLEFDPQLVWAEDPALRKRRCGGGHEEEKEELKRRAPAGSKGLFLHIPRTG